MIKQRDPSVQTLLQNLRSRIERGDYQAGTWLPAERELAAEFGVHRSVVRTVLATLAEQELIVRLPGRRPWVSELRSPAPKTGMRDQHTALSQSIVAIMPQHTRFASSLTILGSINRVLRQEEAPYRLVIFDNYGQAPTVNIEEERAALRSAQEDASGVILWSMDVRQTLPEIDSLRAGGIPVVFVDRHAPNWEGDFVGIDNRQAAGEAVDYLLDLGHRRIGFVAGDDADVTTTTRDRGIGYQEALKRRGLAHPELAFILSQDNDTYAQAANYFLGLKQPPTAVFANNDTIAYHFIGELENRGLSVPQDVSVIGFDDTDRFSPRRSRLTTMRQPFDQMGRMAAELLLRRLRADGKAVDTWQLNATSGRKVLTKGIPAVQADMPFVTPYAGQAARRVLGRPLAVKSEVGAHDIFVGIICHHTTLLDLFSAWHILEQIS